MAGGAQRQPLLGDDDHESVLNSGAVRAAVVLFGLLVAFFAILVVLSYV